MNAEEFLRRVATAPPTPLQQAEMRRDLRNIRALHAQARSEGLDPTEGLDLSDPFRHDDEVERIARAARRAGLGTFTFLPKSQKLSWSEEMAVILGYLPTTRPASKITLLDRLHGDDRVEFCRQVNHALDTGEVTETTVRITRRGRAVSHVHFYLEVFAEADGDRGVIGTAQDITDTVRAKEEVNRLARRCETVLTALADRDPVTGLIDGVRFDQEIERALRTGEDGAVLLISIDNVDEITRDLGPEISDQFLRTVASTLTRAHRDNDQIGYLGSGEFGLLLRGLSPAAAEIVAEELLKTIFRQTSLINGHHRRATGVAGLVPFNESYRADSEGVLVDADLAVHRARTTGEPMVSMVGEVPRSSVDRRNSWRERVRLALRQNQFTMHAQPIYELSEERVTRYELLLRLSDGGSLLPPAKFVPMAEKLGMIGEIDQWVTTQAIQLLGHFEPDIQLQVNLSGRSLGDTRLLAEIERLIALHRVDPKRLTFEVTETALIRNLAEAHGFMKRLRDIGCQLALDDFGSGYGSFTYLRSLPFDIVKLDGQLVSGLMENEADQIITRNLVTMLDQLHIRTQAEFVEDSRVLDLLREYGVEFVQGYHVGVPRPVDDYVGGAGHGDAPAACTA